MEDIRKKQVIDGAIQCILDKGLYHFSVKDIAHEAGVSTGIIYHYFKNKDDLLAQVLKQVFQKTHESVIKSVEQIEDFYEKFKTYLIKVSEVPTHNREFCIVFMNYLALAPYKEEVQKITKKFLTNIQSYIDHILKLGVQQGKIDEKKRKTIAPIVATLAVGLSTQWVVSPESFSLEEMNNEWITMLMNQLQQ